MLLAASLLASARGQPAAASMEGWDGSSAAIGSCPLGDEGDECRKRLIMCAAPLYSSPRLWKDGNLGELQSKTVPHVPTVTAQARQADV